jgi:hypothetical protein
MEAHAIRSRLARIAGTRLKRAVAPKQPPFILRVRATSIHCPRADEVLTVARTRRVDLI